MPLPELQRADGRVRPSKWQLGLWSAADQGLSVEEYDSILEVAQNDPDVREKIRQRIRPSVQ